MTQQITFTQKQIDEGIKVMVRALDIGEAGTRGDYTEHGLLYYMFKALEVDPVLADEASVTSVGSD